MSNGLTVCAHNPNNQSSDPCMANTHYHSSTNVCNPTAHCQGVGGWDQRTSEAQGPASLAYVMLNRKDPAANEVEGKNMKLSSTVHMCIVVCM